MYGLRRRYDERAICSSLSMNRMAKIPEMLEPNAVFKGEVHVIERDAEQFCDVKPG